MSKESLDRTVKLLQKRFGAHSAVRGSEDSLGTIDEVIPTGIEVVDHYLLGIGGLPTGRMSEVYGMEGCLAGETFIPYNVRHANGKSANLKGGTIERLYERFHGITRNGKGSYQREQTRNDAVFYTASMNDEGCIFRNKIVDVVCAGVRECLELRTRGGERITATPDHEFFNGDGYVALAELNVGSRVFVHRNVRNIVVADEVISIKAVRKRQTFDVKMDDPFRNLIANKFVVHNCGKSALGLTALASCQRHGGVAVLADPEQSYDVNRAAAFGIDPELLIVTQPENLEELLEQVKLVLGSHDKRHGPMLIVWDSIASTTTKAGTELKAGEFKMGETPRILSAELKKLLPLLKKHRAHLLMLNQIRAKLGVFFGPNTTTPGGNGVKFYSSWRAEFFGGKGVKDANGRHLAKVLTLMTQKTRFSEPFRKVRIKFDYAIGYDNVYSTIEHAKSLGLAQRGAKGAAAHQAALVALGWEPALTIVTSETAEKKDEEE